MKRLAAAIAALVAGCASEASVGERSCEATDDCHPIAAQMPIVWTQLSTGGRDALTPRWTKTPAQLDPSDPEVAPGVVYVNGSLTSAPNGGLWFFGGVANTLIAKRLDADGAVLVEQRLGAPDGFVPAPSAPPDPMIAAVDDHPLGPTLLLSWPGACDVDPDGHTSSCVRKELVVFSEDAAAAPKRLEGSRLDPKTGELGWAAYRSQRGDSVLVPFADNSWGMFDLQGNQLWRRTLPHDLPNFFSTASLSYPEGQAAFDSDGSFLFNVDWSTEASNYRGVLLRQPIDGSAPSTLEYLVSVEASPNGAIRAGLHASLFAIDPRGRRLVLAYAANGDLAMLRFDASNAEGLLLLREDYSDLTFLGTAMDPAGTLHAALGAGGRLPDAQYTVLCSFPMEGTARCRALDERIGQLAAPAPGVVYTLGPRGLSRYDPRNAASSASRVSLRSVSARARMSKPSSRFTEPRLFSSST